ncbi:MAG: hypothetical protein FJW35_09075, partial [Acidobacteria bacterium]|nr:hypothetical protein [Acidobacteriota bacterium]
MKLHSRKAGILLVCTSLASVSLLVLALLHTSTARQYVLGAIGDYLRDQAGIDLSAEDLRYNLFTLSGSLRGLRLKSAGAPEAPEFLRVGQAEFRLHFPAGLSPALSAALDGVDLEVLFDAQGRSNLPAARPTGETAPPDFLVSSL